MCRRARKETAVQDSRRDTTETASCSRLAQRRGQPACRRSVGRNAAEFPTVFFFLENVLENGRFSKKEATHPDPAHTYDPHANFLHGTTTAAAAVTTNMAHLVKIKLGGDLRIMEIPSPPRFDELVMTVIEAYSLPAGVEKQLTFTYKDNDGDEVRT